jgi:hypothetical protein
MADLFQKSGLLIFIFLLCASVNSRLVAQIPQDIPHQTEPVDFSSPLNILFYIGVPLLMIVLYIIIRKSRRKKNEP